MPTFYVSLYRTIFKYETSEIMVELLISLYRSISVVLDGNC